jgi:predicted ribosomally synthesized peptide with SipW-like signal peptide
MPQGFALALVAIGLAAALAGTQTWAAYSATSASVGNSFAAGTVALADNDSGTAVLALAGAVPGDSDTACVTVAYNGSLASALRLYGTTSGTGLDPYLDLSVTRGTFAGAPPAFASCVGFSADATDYVGAGGGVIYDGTLQAFPDDHGTGLVDPRPAGPETWTSGESHVYKLQITLQNNLAARGRTATQTFTWEARNT